MNIEIRYSIDTYSEEPYVELPYGSVIWRSSGVYADIEVPELTKSEIKSHLSALKDIFEETTLLAFVEAHSSYGRHTYDDATELFNATMNDYIERYLNTSQKHEVLELLYTIKGFAVATGESTGCTQDMWMKYFIAIPNTPDDPIDNTFAQGVQNEYAAWAFNDVWQYNTFVNGEMVASCCGFYGDTSYSEPAHMIEAAEEEVEYYVERAKIDYRNEQFNAIKRLVKSVVAPKRVFSPVR